MLKDMHSEEGRTRQWWDRRVFGSEDVRPLAVHLVWAALLPPLYLRLYATQQSYVYAAITRLRLLFLSSASRGHDRPDSALTACVEFPSPSTSAEAQTRLKPTPWLSAGGLAHAHVVSVRKAAPTQCHARTAVWPTGGLKARRDYEQERRRVLLSRSTL